MKKLFLITLLFSLFSLPGSNLFAGSSDEVKVEEEKFNPSTFAIEHIADSHEWHLWTTPSGHHTSVYLPVIVRSSTTGWHLFSSKKLSHGHTHEGFMISHEGKNEGKIVEVDDHGHEVEGKLPFDLSITKAVAALMFSAIIMLLLFISLARTYRKKEIEAPSGMQGFLEPVILFVRDDIAIPNIGHHQYAKFMPYLLTVFFFILLNNLMGLIPFFPFGANVTGNISVTATLALFTMVITQVSANKQYWRHIFATPGVPFWLLPIMIPIEFIGIFTKPFALTVRLFANITAGHIIILSLVGLIFIFGTLWVSPVTVFFVLFMNLLELLVAFLQAYIFTLLSALFIGQAVQEHH